MSSIPKVVGVLSCAFMLCLGLSGTAALAADDMQLGKSGERMGGQSGHRSDEDKLKAVVEDSSRKRMGGQAGHRGAEDVLERSPAKNDVSPVPRQIFTVPDTVDRNLLDQIN